MDGDVNESASGIQEILRRWRKYLLILLPTVVIALGIGVALGTWWIPGALIPLLIAPLFVALLFRNVKVPESPWHLVYQGPLKNGRLVRAELEKHGIRSQDPSDQDMGGRSGSGGHLECAVFVDRLKAEEAYTLVRRFIDEHPDLFQDPPARV